MSDSYDQVPYTGLPLAQTHPDRLATIATLFEMAVVPPEECRVLELGCGDGGNLIPMALGLPESRFLGIDLAARAIEQGCSLVDALGLHNITLRHLDLMEAGPELGEFDYIIAHGVYSWVPEQVRERLLHICRANLAPKGVAYVSYNTYPGFHRREMFREMMLRRVDGVEDPAERVRQGIELIDLLNQCSPEGKVARALYTEELRHLKESEWWYVHHDDLAPVNHAEYFHGFVGRAMRHGLKYLGEADFFEMQSDIYAEPVAEALRRFAQGDMIGTEQYLDFIKGRPFRQTLLCRNDVTLHRPPRPEQLTPFYIASAAAPVSAKPDLRAGVFEEFRGPRGSVLRTDDHQVKTALLRLQEAWPQSLPFAELLALAEGGAAPLADALLQAYSGGLLEVSIRPRKLTARAGDWPTASPLARRQAQNGRVVTTLRHTAAELADDVDRGLLSLLDGTRDRAALAEAVRAFLRARAMPGAEAVTLQSLADRLSWFASQALLLA